jgi:hypothetical protein
MKGRASDYLVQAITLNPCSSGPSGQLGGSCDTQKRRWGGNLAASHRRGYREACARSRVEVVEPGGIDRQPEW